MGVDDAVCDLAPDGVHDFRIDEITGNSTGGLALIHECDHCGAVSYEATAADRRPPL